MEPELSEESAKYKQKYKAILIQSRHTAKISLIDETQ